MDEHHMRKEMRYSGTHARHHNGSRYIYLRVPLTMLHSATSAGLHGSAHGSFIIRLAHSMIHH